MFNIPQNDWQAFFEKEMRKSYFSGLCAELKKRYDRGDTIFPPREKIFSCFFLTDLNNVKVVILGQDPYHQPGQAMGLSFSVPENVKIPPSLENIYKEIRSDLGRMTHNTSGDLTRWAREGVLLLNNQLTVEKNKPMSHNGIGWETFTENAIKEISDNAPPCVFLLWGRPAQAKLPLINKSRHLVLTAPHPSPLSASTGFFGCKHFSVANDFLAMHGITPVSW